MNYHIDVINFLSSYVRINTAHPTPDYNAALGFLECHANTDQLMHQRVALGNGKHALIISYPWQG